MAYDHELKVGTKTEGLKLARDKDGAALYRVFEPEQRQYQAELRFSQDDWLGGHGQHDFKQRDMYFEGQSIDTTQDGRIILGPLINSVGISGASLGANPVCFCWFEAITKLMVATATKVFWYDGTNFVEKEEFAGETITDMKVYNDVLYVALGSGSKWYTSANGADFTITDLSNTEAQILCVAPNPAGTASVLWSANAPNKLYNTTNGAAGGTALSSAAYIGDTSDDITNIFLVADNLMIGKLDNLYHYDSDGGLHPLMNDLLHNRSANNFKYVVEWQCSVILSLGIGLGEIWGYNTFETMGPLTRIDDIGKTATGCIGLASDKDFLYVGMDEGTNNIIYKGREITRERGLRWEWCPLVFLGTNACATMKVIQHDATDRRLWFGYGNYAAYVILSDNPTADDTYKFAASGWIRQSYEHGTNRYWKQLWQSTVTETAGCTTNLTVTPKYRKDTDTSATQLTDAITTNGIVKTDLIREVNANRMQFELHLATNDSSSTPEVLFFEARGVEQPEKARIHEATYIVGHTLFRKPKPIWDFLEDARDSTELIKFADLRYGQSTSRNDFKWVVMQPGYPVPIELTQTKGKQPELAIRVRLQEVSYPTS